MSLMTYLKDTKGELAHVSWPTRTQAIALAAVVVVVSLIVSFYLGFLDYLIKLIFTKFIL